MATMYWSPYLLAAGGAILAIVSLLPILVTGLGLKRWYQTITLLAWVLWAGVVLLAVIYSSPWLLLGAALVVSGAAAIAWAKRRLARQIEGEAISFLQSLITVMAVGKNLDQALREAAQSSDFSAAYPRLTEQTREVVSQATAGKPLSEAAAAVAESASKAAGRVWDQINLLARLIEEAREDVTTDVQRDTLQSSWALLVELNADERLMRQEMSQINMAKWVITIIIPIVNVVMAFYVRGYMTYFLGSIIGWIVLGIEATAIACIFVVFSLAQNLPEVRI